MPPSPQSILIVGGTAGIGLSTALFLLASTPSSTQITVFGLSPPSTSQSHSPLEQLPAEKASRLHVCYGDVTSPTDRARAVEGCASKAGGSIDVMIYCAGIINPIERMEKLSIDAFRRAYEINVFGVLAMSQLTLPYLRRSNLSPQPRIVVLSSACDNNVTYSGWSAYCTSKAALTRLIQMLAHENRDEVLVQGVYPRLTNTAMPQDVIAGKYKDIMYDEEIRRFQDWAKQGDTVVEPAEWCAEAVAKVALGETKIRETGRVAYYDEFVPDIKKQRASRL